MSHGGRGDLTHPVGLGIPGERHDDLEGLAQRDHLHGGGGGSSDTVVPVVEEGKVKDVTKRVY